MTTLNTNEIKALITLLDDPEKDIFQAVRGKLFQLGVGVIPFLEKAWETILNQETQEKLEYLISDIQYNSVFEALKDWSQQPNSIIYGSTIIARFQYPELKEEMLQDAITKIVTDAQIELKEQLTALEKVRVLNHVFFEIHRFTPNLTNFYAPQNYYLNQVIESKKGNPISLAMIYSEVAKQLGMPVFGVNLPKNFILAFRDELTTKDDDNILFYINPYNKGAVLGHREIDYFLKKQNISPREEYYKPCTNIDIIKRLINNLINSYESSNEHDKIERLQNLLGLL